CKLGKTAESHGPDEVFGGGERVAVIAPKVARQEREARAQIVGADDAADAPFLALEGDAREELALVEERDEDDLALRVDGLEGVFEERMRGQGEAIDSIGPDLDDASADELAHDFEQEPRLRREIVFASAARAEPFGDLFEAAA